MSRSKVQDLDTPCLLLDLAASERNLARMAEFFRGRACQLRPHFKNHKCVTLARRQLDAGSAVGITCAKLGEAEVLSEAGFEDLLIANQVVGKRKIERLVRVASQSRIGVAVDDLGQASEIAAAARASAGVVGILVEVDIGMGRCGVPGGDPALELVRGVVKLDGIRFDGIQAFEGHIVYLDDADERAKLARESLAIAVDTRKLIEADGIPVGVISGGSSSTYAATGAIVDVDELQAGTYATMDWRYHELVPEFEIALTVLARVISKRDGAAVLDVGVKGAGGEFGPPRVVDFPDAEAPFFLSEEHLMIRNAPREWNVGHAIELYSSHACTTCNLYREMVLRDGDEVIGRWPIEGAGRLA
jgi:D-serine deaminase-like pyridoxal phosphate-dependent protein